MELNKTIFPPSSSVKSTVMKELTIGKTLMLNLKVMKQAMNILLTRNITNMNLWVELKVRLLKQRTINKDI